MPSNNPWDVLPVMPKGDETPEALYRSVGVALTVWERLDEEQAGLFAVLTGARGSAAVAAYGTVVSPAGRAEMVGAAARSVLPDKLPLLATILTTVNEIGKLAGRRNDIAHGIVTRFQQQNAPASGAPVLMELGHYLVPSASNTRKKLNSGAAAALIFDPDRQGPIIISKYGYIAAQVDQYREHFSAYRLRLLDLQTKAEDTLSFLAGHRDRILREESPEPAAQLPSQTPETSPTPQSHAPQRGSPLDEE